MNPSKPLLRNQANASTGSNPPPPKPRRFPRPLKPKRSPSETRTTRSSSTPHPLPSPHHTATTSPATAPVRLQKFLSEAGVVSRRAGEAYIQAGRVTVNGQIASQLGTKVVPSHDRIEVDGKRVQLKKKLYVAVHKPRGCLCTCSDPQQRPTIGQLLPSEWRHLYPVGRLDSDSEGLIFLTNDGQFSLRMTHPRYGVVKTYRATVKGQFHPSLLNRLTQGITDAGDTLRARHAHIHSSAKDLSVVELELAEGKNREVRRMFDALDLTVTRLVRTRIGPIRLGELRPGRWRTLTESEINSLLQKL